MYIHSTKVKDVIMVYRVIFMLLCVSMHVHADSKLRSKFIPNNDDIIFRWKKRGVEFEQPQFVVIDPDVQIGKGSTIGCGVHILGASTIGKGCSIGHFTIIKDCSIGDNVQIHSHCVLENAIIKSGAEIEPFAHLKEKAHIDDNVQIHSHCVLENTIIESGAEIGPFAHLEEKAHIQEKAVIGNFVQVKRSTIGPGSKAKHLAYLGDATLGKKVNIAAGVITCNYNGVSKQEIKIDDHAFIGTNNSLVAPVYIGKGAMTAAGSTITRNVPDNALAIGRSPEQINKLDYVPKLMKRYQKEKEARNKNSC